MKRIFALLLTLGLLFATTIASAEEFSLHNGITFGDTMDEVLAKETFAIKSIDDGSDEDSDKDEESDYPYSIITEDDTLAGIPSSHIEYRFNRDKVLREAIYHFSPYPIESSRYEEINSGLVRKYGASLGYSNGDCYIFSGSSLETAALKTTIYKAAGEYSKLVDYDEWDVDTGDYHVKIEQVEYYYGLSGDLEFIHNVGYTYFTDEDIQNIKKERENERTEKQNAMDNDL